MEDKTTAQPPGNTPLMSMLLVGAIMMFIGGIVWLANTDLEYDPSAFSPGVDESNPVGQAIGAGMLSFATLLLALGWTAAAIARAIQIGKV